MTIVVNFLTKKGFWITIIIMSSEQDSILERINPLHQSIFNQIHGGFDFTLIPNQVNPNFLEITVFFDKRPKIAKNPPDNFEVLLEQLFYPPNDNQSPEPFWRKTIFIESAKLFRNYAKPEESINQKIAKFKLDLLLNMHQRSQRLSIKELLQKGLKRYQNR
jgi:hypothetical protein